MDIQIVENVESIDEKLKKYRLTGLESTFLAMEEELHQEASALACTQNLNKMINKALQNGCFLITGETINVALEQPSWFTEANCPETFRLESTEIGCSNIKIKPVKYQVDTTWLGTKPIFSRAQNDVGLDLAKLCECVFPKLEIDWPQTILPRFGDLSAQTFKNLLPHKKYKCISELKPEILLSENQKHLTPKIMESAEKIMESYKNIEENIWDAILQRLVREFGSDFHLNKLGIKHLFVPACEHTIDSDLKLVGDFFVCSHDNPIVCRHITVENMDERVAAFSNPCKICGEKFIKMRETLIQDVDFQNVKFDAELHKKLYGKTMIALKNIKFKNTISDDFIRKLVKNLVGAIVDFVANNNEKLDQTKGVNVEVIQAMKEIIAQLYIYGALVNLCNRNEDIKFETKNKSNKDAALEILSSILRVYTSKIKNFKVFNLNNSFIAVLEELRTSVPVVQTSVDFERKEFPTQEFLFGKQVVLPNVPCIRFGPNINFENVQPQLNMNYVSYIYDDNHKHKWTMCATNIGTKKISEIEMHEFIEDLICEVCGKKYSQIEMQEKSIAFAIKTADEKALHDFYIEYCPVNNVHVFEKNICVKCGYGGPNFKYTVPSNKIILGKSNEHIEMITELQKGTEAVPKNYDFAGTVIKDKTQYINFWNNLWCNEDKTIKQLLAGEQGNVLFAIPKIILEFNALATYIGKNISTETLEIVKQINILLKIPSPGDFEILKNKFIHIFNQVNAPDYFKNLVKRIAESAMSEEDVKAAALISFKQKIANDVVKDQDSDLDNADEQTKEAAKNAFGYEGFDYEGQNDEIGDL